MPEINTQTGNTPHSVRERSRKSLANIGNKDVTPRVHGERGESSVPNPITDLLGSRAVQYAVDVTKGVLVDVPDRTDYGAPAGTLITQPSIRQLGPVTPKGNVVVDAAAYRGTRVGSAP